MTQVLDKVREVDPNDSEAVKDAVNTFFQNLQKIDISESIKWFRSLGDVLNRFPKYCMSHRNSIENIISEAIDSNNYYYVIEAAKCAQALQQVRPSQEKTATPKSSWRDQMNLLCNAAHSLIGALFPNAVDMYKGTNNSKDQQQNQNSILTVVLLNVKSLNNMKNKGEKQTSLQIRLRNIFCFIQAMLVEVYPVAKPIRPQTILDVVVRALSVSTGTKNVSVDVALIKIEALRTLDALVACLGSNFIPFSPLVFRLLMQTIRWSSENAEKDFSNVRCSAYSSLGKWLNTLHSHRSASDSRASWEDELTNQIIADIAPPEKVVELTMGPQPTKNMSKKARRKLANANLLGSSIASHMPGEKNKTSVPEEVNNAVAMAALECAEIFLLVSGRFLKPATHKLFQERTIRECYNAHKYSEEQLLLLLRVVEATRKTTPANIPPPTQYCLQLYSVLVNCGLGEISKFCTQALLDIRLHLHCSPPSLNFALEAPQEKLRNNKRRTVSEKNMTALKTLLGPDRISALAMEEDTTPDEPSSKKPRIEDDDDRISVSSDSITSVASDDSDVQEVESDGDDVEEVVEKVSPKDNVTNMKTSEDQTSNTDFDESLAHAIDVAEKDIAELKEQEVIDKLIDVVDSKNMEIDVDVENNDKDQQETMDVNKEKTTIHEAPTQMPLNVSTESNEAEEGPLSSEITYDYQNTKPVDTVIEDNTEEEVLPCTNESDDIVITCGQIIKSSPETEPEKKSEDTDISSEVNILPKVNGKASDSELDQNDTEIPSATPKKEQNDKVNGNDVEDSSKTDKIQEGECGANTTVSKGEVSIEDMIADFVDELKEDVAVA